jgi:hypothetical protein
VQKRILSIAIVAFLFSLIFAGCSKLDTTDIGSDLLPAVDNVTTFDTLLTINSSQGVFNTDSTKISNADDLVLGKINNDPLFGTTKADVYAQFKPTFYPYYYGNAGDTIVGYDSVVLCLSYKGVWGDSTFPLQLQVKEVALNAAGLWDSVNQSKDINYAPATGNLIGSTTVDIASLGNYVKYANGKDSVKNQIRIKLSTAFANSLFARDTNLVGNNSFRSDSLFKTYNNGFAIIANGGGNSLLYTNLTDSSSKLEVHFRRKNGGAIDTTFSALKIYNSYGNTVIAPSSTANNIVRNRSGYPVSSPASNEIYLQTSPGTFANLNIPALSTLSNRVIHRAEIIIEQIPYSTQSDAYFSAPNFLYIDLKDTSVTSKWKPVYFDLNPNTSYDPDFKVNTFFPGGSGVDYLYHGGYVRNKTDQFSNKIKYYNFNITRYIQQIVTSHSPNYQLRLYAPYIIEYPQYASDFDNGKRSGSNRLAYGRVKVGGGNNANYKMRLRLVYSKI